jgi:hemerythrin-like domain-containing protein
MKVTQILMEEHRIIERVLAALEKAAKRLEAGEPIQAGFFIEAADFVKGFADGCHHKKEEGVLFKSLTQHDLSEQAGPVAVMLAEHEQGRTFTRAMREAALKLKAGDQSAKQAIIHNSRGYAALLRQHIAKEDGVLFPMADRVIPPEDQGKVAEDFERIEEEETGEGMHEKYLALAEKLAKEANQTI